MKKILYSFLMGVVALGFNACIDIDNFDEPAASVHGRLIDTTTGENYMTDQGDVHIRIWEKSYSTNPTPQDLAVKMDGSYNREKLFAGTYDMLPYDGSWWPCDTTFDVPIGNTNHAEKDFKVTPYLKIKDFKAELIHNEKTEMDTIAFSGRLFAPITRNLPQVLEIRPFLSINQYCGASNHLDYYYSNDYRINVRQDWSRLGDMETGEGAKTYTIKCPVKKGYTYWCRMGANVRDTNQKFNYSEIVKIEVPQN